MDTIHTAFPHCGYAHYPHCGYAHYPHCNWEEPDMEKATDGNIKSRLTIFSSNRSSFRSVTIFLRIYKLFFQDSFSALFLSHWQHWWENLGPNCCWCANGSRRGEESVLNSKTLFPSCKLLILRVLCKLFCTRSEKSISVSVIISVHWVTKRFSWK